MSAARMTGARELRTARAQCRSLYWAVGIFSVVVNLLMLTGPLYMMQVYDRVLGSRSEATLVGLTLIMVFLYLNMALLDYVRGRIMARAGARFQQALDRRVFEATLRAATRDGELQAGRDGLPKTGLRDLEAVQRLMTSPVLMAFFDLPWTPLFLGLIFFVFHPWLGILSIAGGLALVAITLLNQWLSTQPLTRANIAGWEAERQAEHLRGEAESVESLGMRGAAFERWQKARFASLEAGVSASDVSGGFTTLSKSMRLMLQSLILGLGAYLVLKGELAAGAMIAASILFGRAMAPVDLLIGQWAVVSRAQKGWADLTELLEHVPPTSPRTTLPRPRAILDAQQVTVIPPGQHSATLRMVNFRIEPGQALGVIGPSGAGKTTLARSVIGLWRAAGGKIRLDGASLDQYDPDKLGEYIGYLPQRVQLFDGTIAENIARLEQRPDPERVVSAAKRAAAHEMIVKFPDGYDTRISSSGGRLSGGQVQRIGLARALYSNPVMLVLDEPNSNLDNEGTDALNQAIRSIKAEGGAIIIMAHRPAAIAECELLMVLDNGTRVAFGPKDQVLRETVANHSDLRPGLRGGAA